MKQKAITLTAFIHNNNIYIDAEGLTTEGVPFAHKGKE